MKIQYISDLHLEFPENREYIRNNPIIPSADILVIAGDLGYLNLRRKHHIYEKYCDSFLEYCSKNWKYTIVIPGNHEWYGGNAMNKTPTRYDIYDNVTFLNDRISDLMDVNGEKIKIYGTTLWSNINSNEYLDVSRRMNDYRLIKLNSQTPFTVGSSIEMHLQAVNAIKWLPNKETRMRSEKHINGEIYHTPYKLVIATHHGCHPKCIHKKYNGSALNSAYSTDLCEVIKTVQPEAWIFGHTHCTQSFKYENTIIAENSLGYVGYGESLHFKHNQTLEI